MKLSDRLSGLGKYAIIEMHKNDHLEFGEPETEDEFFVLKLKDIHSEAALLAYAISVGDSDPEYREEILKLASRAGSKSQWCKYPD